MTEDKRFSIEDLNAAELAQYVPQRLANKAPPPLNVIHNESVWSVLYAAGIDWALRRDDRVNVLLDAASSVFTSALSRRDLSVSRAAADLLHQLALSPQKLLPQDTSNLSFQLLSEINGAAIEFRALAYRLLDAWGEIDTSKAIKILEACCDAWRVQPNAQSAMAVRDAFERYLRQGVSVVPSGQLQMNLAGHVAQLATVILKQATSDIAAELASTILRLSWLHDKASGRVDLARVWLSFLQTHPAGDQQVSKDIWLSWAKNSAQRYWKTADFEMVFKLLNVELDSHNFNTNSTSTPTDWLRDATPLSRFSSCL